MRRPSSVPAARRRTAPSPLGWRPSPRSTGHLRRWGWRGRRWAPPVRPRPAVGAVGFVGVVGGPRHGGGRCGLARCGHPGAAPPGTHQHSPGGGTRPGGLRGVHDLRRRLIADHHPGPAGHHALLRSSSLCCIYMASHVILASYPSDDTYRVGADPAPGGDPARRGDQRATPPMRLVRPDRTVPDG